jgi:hypothetical protein
MKSYPSLHWHKPTWPTQLAGSRHRQAYPESCVGEMFWELEICRGCWRTHTQCTGSSELSKGLRITAKLIHVEVGTLGSVRAIKVMRGV